MATAAMQDMSAAVSSILTKVSFLEKRSMNDNMKPHEAVRQLMQVLSEFDMNGDPQWPLRSMRDICLDYMRALSARYGGMAPDVRAALVKLVMFESCKRHIWTIHGDREGLRKYEAIMACSQTIEENESGACRECRFFCSGELKVESLERGYLACEAYVWLGQHGDAVSKYEMQTILLENEAEVRNRTTAMNNEFLRLIEEAKKETQMRQGKCMTHR